LLAVIGDAEVTVAQDQAVIWEISGDLDAKKLPTDGAGTLSVKGNANFAEAVTTITGAIDIGGNATFAAALTTDGTNPLNVGGDLSVGGIFTVGAGDVTVDGGLAVSGTYAVSLGGDLTVGGTATLGGVFGNTAAASATFNGATTIAGAVTSDTGGLTIAGTGAVALTSSTGVTLTKNMTVKNTGGVTVAGAIDLSTALKATGVTVKGESGTGVVMGTDSHTAITLPATTSITVPVGGSVVAGDETGKVTILGGAVLKAGTYTATDVKTATLTLGANAVLEVQDGGSIAISAASPDEGQIVLADNTSKIFLLAGGSFAAGAKGTIIKNGGTMTGVTLTVGTTDKPGVATKAVVSTAGTVFTVTTEATTGVTGDVIVGVIKWVTGTDPVSAKAGVDPTTGAAAGSIKAGAGTTLTISTTS
jgi:hypothetical protein